MREVQLFGRAVTLYRRKAKHFFEMQETQRNVVRLGAEARYLANELKKDTTKDLELKAIDAMRDYEVNSLFYSIKMLSNSLKVGRKWWKIWNWNLYRKFEQSYILKHLDPQEISKYAEVVGELEGNKKVNENELPEDYIPLDRNKVISFVHTKTGIPRAEVLELDVIELFDNIDFAWALFKLQVEGGKLNLTSEDEMAHHFAQYKRAKERGWLGKNSKLMQKAKKHMAQA